MRSEFGTACVKYLECIRKYYLREYYSMGIQLHWQALAEITNERLIYSTKLWAGGMTPANYNPAATPMVCMPRFGQSKLN